ncbi:MAG: type I-E CRISPR-associated protein Cas7/Cse4/CasC [Micrococcales bacterium]|nr:type I-E CRISPR-associated protein Cas7/Cse4/CasC [Micrococcales bacterium]MCL2668203.1 type I-E CRISPR-associated protein Cas7/Cse4/CasC [Micrococcales bacterium]
MTTFIDMHLLQTVPSSNINRDDTGSPKSAVFGGVRRARVSSQAWKRATRRDFATYLDESERGIRTRRIMVDLVERIQRLDGSLTPDEALTLGKAVMTAASRITFEKPKRGKKNDETADTADAELSQYLIFISNQQLDRLAALALTGRDGTTIDKAAAKNALKDGNGIEVALFGRMVADDVAYNVDASVQVAHAISTHAVETEYDYFTAVDDAKPDDEDAGAGMIGWLEFNSSTLYRYATINLDQLAENLGDVETTGRAVEAFLRSFVVSMPTGKQNTFANSTLPEAALVQVRTRRPVNLVGAFEEPVTTKPDESISVQSAARLAQKAQEIDDAYGNTPTAAYLLAVGSRVADALAGTGEALGLDALVAQVGRDAVAALQESV